MSAVDSGGIEGPSSDELAASTNPPEISCFPLPLGLETSGALAISDVDDDGVRDMVIGAETVYLIDGECQEPLDGDDDAQTFGPIYDASARFEPSSITLGDLDPNRRGLEIVAMNRDTRELVVLDGRATYCRDGRGRSPTGPGARRRSAISTATARRPRPTTRS